MDLASNQIQEAPAKADTANSSIVDPDNTVMNTTGNGGATNTAGGTDAMTGQMNLLDFLAQPGQSAVPEIVRLGQNEVAAILFTASSTAIKVHYCDEPEIRSFVHCVGERCLLCRAGKRAEDRVLLPVVVPTERRIGLLMISTSLRPGSLLHQLGPHLKTAASGGREIVFLRRDGMSFSVTARTLRAGEDEGAVLVKEFLADVEAGTYELRQAVQGMTDEQLMAVPSIREMLVLKGVITS